MARFDVLVRVTPRATLLDPQGRAVEHALGALGYRGVRVGKALAFQLDRSDPEAAEQDARAMCERLPADPVTEDFEIPAS
jgi:phosphoribosylformylglycinamidine synthase PurS subunit